MVEECIDVRVPGLPRHHRKIPTTLVADDFIAFILETEHILFPGLERLRQNHVEGIVGLGGFLNKRDRPPVFVADALHPQCRQQIDAQYPRAPHYGCELHLRRRRQCAALADNRVDLVVVGADVALVFTRISRALRPFALEMRKIPDARMVARIDVDEARFFG